MSQYFSSHFSLLSMIHIRTVLYFRYKLLKTRNLTFVLIFVSNIPLMCWNIFSAYTILPLIAHLHLLYGIMLIRKCLNLLIFTNWLLFIWKCCRLVFLFFLTLVIFVLFSINFIPFAVIILSVPSKGENPLFLFFLFSF